MHNFGANVESKTTDQKTYCVFYDDENEYKYTPQQVAKSILIAAGFGLTLNENVIDIDDVLSWTFLLLSEFCDDKHVYRKAKNFIALTSRRLGVGQCSNAKNLITGSSPAISQLKSKESKHNITHDLIYEICGQEPTKEDLRGIIWEITKFDPSAAPPNSSASKTLMWKWISENISIYYLFLENLSKQ